MKYCQNNHYHHNENDALMHTVCASMSLQWRHNERDGVSNHQPHDCLLNRLFRHRSQKTSKLRVTGFCEGNSPVTGEFPAQRASNAEKVSIWWRHHVLAVFCYRNILPIFPMFTSLALSHARDYLSAFVRTRIRYRLAGIEIPIINLRRSSDRLMFIITKPIPLRRRLLINRDS